MSYDHGHMSPTAESEISQRMAARDVTGDVSSLRRSRDTRDDLNCRRLRGLVRTLFNRWKSLW